MRFTGIADEAGAGVDVQIRAAKELGWNAIEMRKVAAPGGAAGFVHEIPDGPFEEVRRVLDEAGVKVPAIGSTVANWARPIEEPFDVTRDQLDRLIPRAEALGTKYIRIMSYAVRQNEDGSDHADQMVAERIRRLREITSRLTAVGLVAVHENCMNYGGMAASRTLELLAAVPDMKLVFDTGNPVSSPARDGESMQDPWAFYQAVKDHIVHVHIKDCVWNAEKGAADHTWPGDGDGRVRDILADLQAGGYQGWISIEPHLDAVLHDTGDGAGSDADRKYRNFVEYGRRLKALVCGL